MSTSSRKTWSMFIFVQLILLLLLTTTINAAAFFASSRVKYQKMTPGTEQSLVVSWETEFKNIGAPLNYHYGIVVTTPAILSSTFGATCYLTYLSVQYPGITTKVTSSNSYIFNLTSPAPLEDGTIPPFPLNIEPLLVPSPTSDNIVKFTCAFHKPRRYTPTFLISLSSTNANPSTYITSATPFTIDKAMWYPPLHNVTISYNPPFLKIPTSNLTVVFSHNALQVARGTGLSVYVSGTSVLAFTMMNDYLHCWVNGTTATIIYKTAQRINVRMPFNVIGAATIQLECRGFYLKDNSYKDSTVWVEYFDTTISTIAVLAGTLPAQNEGFYFAGGKSKLPVLSGSKALNPAEFTFNTVGSEIGKVTGTVTAMWEKGLGTTFTGGINVLKFLFPIGIQPTYPQSTLEIEGSICTLSVNNVLLSAANYRQGPSPPLISSNPHKILLSLYWGFNIQPTDRVIFTCTLIESYMYPRLPYYDISSILYVAPGHNETDYGFADSITHKLASNRLGAIVPLSSRPFGSIVAKVELSNSTAGARTTLTATVNPAPTIVDKIIEIRLAAPVYRPQLFSSTDLPYSCNLLVDGFVIQSLVENTSPSAFDTTGADDGLMIFTLMTSSIVSMTSSQTMVIQCQNMVVHSRIRDTPTSFGYISVSQEGVLIALKDDITQPIVTLGQLRHLPTTNSSTLVDMITPGSHNKITFGFTTPFISLANEHGLLLTFPSGYSLGPWDQPRNCTLLLGGNSHTAAPVKLLNGPGATLRFFLALTGETMANVNNVITCPIVMPSYQVSIEGSFTIQMVNNAYSLVTNIITTKIPIMSVLSDLTFCSKSCGMTLSRPYVDEYTDMKITLNPIESNGDISITLLEDVFVASSILENLNTCEISRDKELTSWTMTYNSELRQFVINRSGTASGVVVISCTNFRTIPTARNYARSAEVRMTLTDRIYSSFTIPATPTRPTTASITFSDIAGREGNMIVTLTSAPELSFSLFRSLRIPIPRDIGLAPSSPGLYCSALVNQNTTVIELANAALVTYGRMKTYLLVPSQAGFSLSSAASTTITCGTFVIPSAQALLSDIGLYIDSYNPAASPVLSTPLYVSQVTPLLTISPGITTGSFLTAIVPHTNKATVPSGNVVLEINPIQNALLANSWITFTLPPSWNVPSTPTLGSTTRCTLRMYDPTSASTMPVRNFTGTAYALRLWNTIHVNALGKNTRAPRTMYFHVNEAIPATNYKLSLSCGLVSVPAVATPSEYGTLALLGPDGGNIMQTDFLYLPPIYLDKEGISHAQSTIILRANYPLYLNEANALVSNFRDALGFNADVNLVKQTFSGASVVLSITVKQLTSLASSTAISIKSRLDDISSKLGMNIATSSSSLSYFIETCSDSRQNRLESDTDCGGTECPQCTWGKKCRSDSDCLSTNCVNNVCVNHDVNAAADVYLQSVFAITLVSILSIMFM